MPRVNMKKTGTNIKAMMQKNKIKATDIQDKCGFGTPQAVFKWMRGDCLPTIDNMVIIADMFGVTINDIIVIDRAWYLISVNNIMVT